MQINKNQSVADLNFSFCSDIAPQRLVVKQSIKSSNPALPSTDGVSADDDV